MCGNYRALVATCTLPMPNLSKSADLATNAVAHAGGERGDYPGENLHDARTDGVRLGAHDRAVVAEVQPSQGATVLVVDDDRAIRRTLEKFLSDAGHEVLTALDGQQAWEILQQGRVDVCLLDLGLPVVDGMQVLENVTQKWPLESEPPAMIIISARDDMRTTVQAVKLGAYDYLVKPVVASRIRLTVQRAMEQRRTSLALAHLIAQERTDHGVDNMIGKSEAMREVYKRIGAVAATRATVLVRGESGTGKELVARAIHQASSLVHEPFVAVNCTAFAPELLESELFGHVRGAFTGAVSDKVGRFQLASTGTLFLDEIGELRADLQTKLLRVLQERVFERVGDTRSVALNARIIAATHRDLEQMLRDGSFREDLYYRLRVVEIVVPPLRERRDDIPRLVDHLLGKIAQQTRKTQVKFVSAEAMDALMAYRWPGNVRELENALTRAVVLCKGEVLGVDALPMTTLAKRAKAEPDVIDEARIDEVGNVGEVPWDRENREENEAFYDPIDMSLSDVQRRHIERVLLHTGWHKRKACAILQITRPTLDRKIREFGLEKPPNLAR